ncbi:hypothetical protein [Sphingobium sp. AEW010]|uniref:hypothetical protein n=1 Tax=unclassified Sphingobium TaxID=2611147 RepID=UPI0039656BC7
MGAARRALADFLAIARERRSLMSAEATRDNPAVHAMIARAEIAIRDAEARFDRHCDDLDAAAAGSHAMTEREGLIMRAELTEIMRKMAEIVDGLQLHLGARGLSMASPLTRPWLDLQAARVHPGNEPGPSALLAGRALLDA